MLSFNDLLENNTHEPVQTANKITYNIPWVDKYRPKKLSQVVYQDDVIRMLNKVLETGNLPHLLFYGQAGTGKTSTILAIAMELFGPKKFRERIIELNASDERGINIVRNKILNMAKSSVSSNDTEYKCPSYKIIILDEADAMTTEAQSALRKIMEDNSNVTRFCFICNYINQIITPIISRCAKFKFKPIHSVPMTNKLRDISKLENIDITDSAIQTISKISNGDMRKGIMFLQNLNYLNKKIESSDVYQIVNMLPYDDINNIVNVAICPNIMLSNASKLNEITVGLIKGGYPINIILKQLTENIVQNDKLTSKQKSYICYHISITEKRLIDGADEFLQLASIFMCLRSVITLDNSIYTGNL